MINACTRLECNVKTIDELSVGEEFVIFSDNPKWVDGDYLDIINKVENLGFEFDREKLHNYVRYECPSKGVYLTKDNKLFSIWHGNTKKFTITRIE